MDPNKNEPKFSKIKMQTHNLLNAVGKPSQQMLKKQRGAKITTQLKQKELAQIDELLSQNFVPMSALKQQLNRLQHYSGITQNQKRHNKAEQQLAYCNKIIAMGESIEEHNKKVRPKWQELYNQNKKLCQEIQQLRPYYNKQKALYQNGRERHQRLMQQQREIDKEEKLSKQMLVLMNKSRKQIEQKTKLLAETKRKKLEQVEKSRQLMRKLNNSVQDSCGNVRVYCRIRPLAPKQQLAKFMYMDSSIQWKKTHNAKSENLKSDYEFIFDKLFGFQGNQQLIYEQMRQIVMSSLDGRNVCIFAYGQTGSGKTYTMMGEKDSQNMGIIPRSFKSIFKEVEKNQFQNFQTNVTISISEIYNDSTFDLISTNGKKKEIKDKDVCTSLEIFKEQDALMILNRAIQLRSTSKTQLNQHSSRSHLLLTIQNQFKKNNCITKGSLVLIDLAGSERTSESGVVGQQLKEANSINKSLTELGRIFRQLSTGQGNVIFRGSKLNKFLEPYLKEQNSKAIMFVNISPALKDESQTLNSLEFASQVRQVKIKKKN